MTATPPTAPTRRVFDTMPLTTRRDRSTYREFRRRMLQTDFGRRIDARARSLLRRYGSCAASSGIAFFVWAQPSVHRAVDAFSRGGALWWWVVLAVVAVFFLLSALVFTPAFALVRRTQWRSLYATREFAVVNGLERHDLADDEAGGLDDKKEWRGLIFLQGSAPRAVVSLSSRPVSERSTTRPPRGAPPFEIGAYQYERPAFRSLIDHAARTSKPARETWGYLRIRLDGAVDVPRIVVRPAADLAPTSTTWSRFTYLDPYWRNPGEALGAGRAYGLFAPRGTEDAARAFFTPALVDLLTFAGAPLEAEVVGCAFYIYKKTTAWSIGSPATFRWLEQVLAAADVGAFSRQALGPADALPPASGVSSGSQDPARPLTLGTGTRRVGVTGPATPPRDHSPGGLAQP